MENFLMLGICFVLGLGLRLGGIIDEKGPAALNAVIIHMSLPSLALLYAHDLPIGVELIMPAAMAWIIFGLGYLFFRAVGGMFGMDEKTIACLTIVAGLGNTSFVGVPMIEAFYGPDYIAIGMLCDTAGTFMALAIPGIILAAKASGQSVDNGALLKKIIFFPPFFSLVLGFALQPVPYPDWFASLLGRLGGTLAPLALLSVGMTLRFREIKSNGRNIFVGLGYKMFLAPGFIFALYMGLLGQTDMVTRVTVFEAAMGPMITGGIIAMSYGLNPSLAASLLGVGIPLSFLTLPIWYSLLELM